MVHIVYDVNSTGHFFGGGVQTGDGISPFFEGIRYQRGFGRIQQGRGVLGVLRRAWKFLKPIAARAKEYISPIANEAMKALADEGLGAGQKILENIAKGVEPKDAVAAEGSKALKSLVKRAGVSLQQKGSVQRAKKKKAARSLSNLQLVGRSVLESAAKQKRLKNTQGLY